MGDPWKHPPLERISFNYRFPMCFSIPRYVGEYQDRLNLTALGLQPGNGGLEFVLSDPKKGPSKSPPVEPAVLLGISHTFLHIHHRNYTTWEEYKKEILQYVSDFPKLPPYFYLGLICINRIPIYPRDEDNIPLDKYLTLHLQGPGSYSNRTAKRIKWQTDYQMERPGHLLRIEVENHDADEDGIEHLCLTTDYRINTSSDFTVDAFLEEAHDNLKKALEAVLQPECLRRLKDGDDNEPHLS